ncbi:UDP-glycosyltransferase family, conserved site [Sesbania bispinosa]|nr:UDP-glycosyltransferase family, conserved site [Sesbania bispinosa]
MVVEVEASKPHVAVLPCPGMGHVIPMLELAKRLVTHHSCHVTFLHITTEASATQFGLLHSPNLPPGLHVLDLPPADLSAVISDDTPVLSHLCINVRESLRSLKSTLTELQKLQALIIDMFCTQAFDICAELSIPTYAFATTSTTFFAFSLLFRNLDADVVSGEFVDLPGCSPLRKEDLPLVNNGDEKWFSYHFCRLHMAAGIFINSYEDLEPVPIQAIKENQFYKEIPTPPVYPIGPLVKETEPVTGKGEECLAWLDKQASGSVLFVALGSGGNLCAEQLTELAWGLELSQQRFLWVVRTPTDASGINNYFKVGADLNDPKSYLPEGFMERNRELGMVVPSWAPQVLVLRHVSTGAFLSHCGWNSVLESVTHGVPIITWPLHCDQRVNATMVAEDMGVAIKPVVEAGRRVIGRKEIERVVRAAMEGEEGKGMRVRVRELRDNALKALEKGGSSFETLAGVTNKWNTM